MLKLNPSEKKLAIIGSATALAFVLFLLFIHIPTTNTVKRIQTELYGKEAQIQAIEAMISEVKSHDEGIAMLSDKLNRLDSKFPAGEESGIRILSGLAKKMNIAIVSLKFDPEVPLVDDNNQAIGIEGKACRKASVFMVLKCDYGSLVRYLSALKEDTTAAEVTIENLTIDRNNAHSPDLNINIELNLYILS